MKIIKHYHDYYDSAIGLAYDDRMVYDRKTDRMTKTELDLSKAPTLRNLLPDMPEIGSHGCTVRGCLLAFCWRVYPFWHLESDPAKWADEADERYFTPDAMFDSLRLLWKSEPPNTHRWRALDYLFGNYR